MNKWNDWIDRRGHFTVYVFGYVFGLFLGFALGFCVAMAVAS